MISRMFASAAQRAQVAPSASAVSALLVSEIGRDMLRIAIPRPEIHVVARFGPAARGGLDVHAMGMRETAHRKLIRRGQRTVMARLRLGAHVSVLGVPASAISGRVVALEDLWGRAAATRLWERLANATDIVEAAATLEGAICERSALVSARSDGVSLALASATLLQAASVSSVTRVASELGVSERHLRRVFREALGVSPKTFARLARFHLALRIARGGKHSWAEIAADSGYYDQAHLIAEFRGLTGVTPHVLLEELREDPTFE